MNAEKQIEEVIALIEVDEPSDVIRGRLRAMLSSAQSAEQGKCLHQIAEPAPTESVLIDGTAYVVHAEVAAELLRLHIELQTAPQAVQAAVPEGLEKREDWIGMERPGTQELIDVMHMRGVYAIPIKDREPIMRCIAKDALAEVTRLKALLSAPAHPAEVVRAQRAAFVEAWQIINYPIPCNSRMRDDGSYADPKVQAAWEKWQARAALADTQPAAQPVATITGLDEFGPLLGWHEHWAKFPVGTNFYTQPAAQGMDAQQYRIIDHGELIQAGDEFLRDDFTWQIDPKGIFVGTRYGIALRPARRAIAAQAKQGGNHG